MYLRFVGTELDDRTGKFVGIFTLAYELEGSEELLPYEQEEIQEILSWFKKRLPIPKKFSRKKNNSHKNTQGLSWMKESSQPAIEKLWELKQILNSKDILIEVQRTHKPGYIVYEDEYQVVAEPFHNEKIDLI